MPSTYPAKLRVWASVVSQGHVATAASGVMVNAAQEIEQLEKELAWSREQTRERQEHGDRLAKRNKELEAALRVAAGYISTKEGHTDQHPQDVYDWIVSSAFEGEKKDG